MSWIENKRLNRRRRLERGEVLNWANYVTYARIILIPVVAILLLPIDDWDNKFNAWDHFASFLAMIFFVVSAMGDLIDGYIARKYNLCSTFGKFLDPLADKLLSFTVLITLVSLSRIPAWIVILLIIRDLTITSLRAVAADEGVIIAASQGGKYKTFMAHCAMGFLIVHYPMFGLNVHGIGMALLGVTLIVSLVSGSQYAIQFFSGLVEKKEV